MYIQNLYLYTQNLYINIQNLYLNIQNLYLYIFHVNVSHQSAFWHLTFWHSNFDNGHWRALYVVNFTVHLRFFWAWKKCFSKILAILSYVTLELYDWKYIILLGFWGDYCKYEFICSWIRANNSFYNQSWIFVQGKNQQRTNLNFFLMIPYLIC